MKSLFLVLLGSLPLAILTANSLLELRSIGEAPSVHGRESAPPPDAAAFKDVPSQVKADKPVADALVATDLLAGETIAGLQDKASSTFEPLTNSWPAWLTARQLIGQTANARPARETASADQLQEQLRALERLRAEYEKSRLSGSEAVMSLLNQRIESIQRRLGQVATEREAESEVTKARDEFQSAHYGRCVTRCDEWLAKYAQLDPAVTAKMRILRDRAQFQAAHEQMRAQFRAADSLASQQAIVASFLTRYSERASPTSKEQQILDQSRRALAQLQARLQADTLSRKAAEAIRGLVDRPPPSVAERFHAAAQLRSEYPTAAVAQSIRAAARGWLAELFAEKPFAEQAGLLEAETRQGQILRGFFRKSIAPDGSLIGYQHFTNYQQYRDPTAQVGTYAKDDLPAAPGVSVPQQYVSRYRQLREELLSQPGRKASWESMAVTCEQFDAQLSEYRKKPGASAEPLSFQAEARSAREVLSTPIWSDVATIFGE